MMKNSHSHSHSKAVTSSTSKKPKASSSPKQIPMSPPPNPTKPQALESPKPVPVMAPPPNHTKPQALESPKPVPVMAPPPNPTKPRALESPKPVPVMAPPPNPTKPQALESPKPVPVMAPPPNPTKPQALASPKQTPCISPSPNPKKPQALASSKPTPCMAPPPNLTKPQALSSTKPVPVMAPPPNPTKSQALSSSKPVPVMASPTIPTRPQALSSPKPVSVMAPPQIAAKPQALSSPKPVSVMAPPQIAAKPQALSSAKPVPVMAPPPNPTKPKALSSPKPVPVMASPTIPTRPQALSSPKPVSVMAPPQIPAKPQAVSSAKPVPVMASPTIPTRPQAFSSTKRGPVMVPPPIPTKRPQALSFSKKTSGMVPPLDLNLPPPVVTVEQGSSSSSQKVYMHNYQSRSAQQLLHNHMNFKTSEIPARFMYYSNESWVDFKEEEVLGAVRDAFAKKRPVIDVDINGVCNIFDFMRMIQIDTKGGSQRSVAWIDYNGKCFFPKLFVSEEDGDDEEEEKEEEKVAGNKLKRKIDDVIEINSLTNGKRPAVAAGRSKWLGAVLLKETDNGFSIVRNHLLSGMGKKDIKVDFVSAHQFARNTPLGQARLQLFQKQMEITEKTRGKANTVYAWYGGSAADIARALVHGFRAVDAENQWIPYGLGVHLSPIGMPYMSDLVAKPDENGEKHMLLCRVVLGNMEKVNPGSLQSRPCSVQFDSGADDPQDPQWFVVWQMNMSSHILPECVVTYKPIHTGPKESVSDKFSLVVLVAKIRAEIPVSKIPQLDALYEKVRDNKMGRIAFLAHLRSLVGVRILKAAAQHAHIRK